jgi:HlyD family secretion protein
VWKWLVGVFLVFVLICGGSGVYVATNKGAREKLIALIPKPPPTKVRLEKVAKGDVVRRVNAPGAIEPKTKVQISSQVSARVEHLPFREGETVPAGELVVKLDAREFQARLEQAQAGLRAQEAQLLGAQANLTQAKADYDRAETLFGSKDIAKAELDTALAAYQRAQSQVKTTEHNIEVARAQITQAQKDLENCTIRSPIHGRVVKLSAEVGELVLVGTLNNPSSVIMEIADLDNMLMKARVDEANIASVAKGQSCRIYINAYPDTAFAGVVERVGLKREIDRDGTGYFEVEIIVTPREGVTLASGLTSNVDIEVQTVPGVLKIPSQAIVDRRIDELPARLKDHPLVDRTKAFARVVYTLKDGQASAVPVRTGASDLTHTVLVEGLKEGEAVITGPFKVLTKLAEGDHVVDESAPEAGGEAAPAGSAAKSGGESGAGGRPEEPEPSGP